MWYQSSEVNQHTYLTLYFSAHIMNQPRTQTITTVVADSGDIESILANTSRRMPRQPSLLPKAAGL